MVTKEEFKETARLWFFMGYNYASEELSRRAKGLGEYFENEFEDRIKYMVEGIDIEKPKNGNRLSIECCICKEKQGSILHHINETVMKFVCVDCHKKEKNKK